MTKHFTNVSAQPGDNVTFTCEAQVDALPIFLFYKLDKSILKAYEVANGLDSFSLLDKYAKSLQNKVYITHFV